jgi:hypothetical protein
MIVDIKGSKRLLSLGLQKCIYKHNNKRLLPAIVFNNFIK